MRQIFVDSRDRVSGTTSDFTIQLPTTLVVPSGTHKLRVDNLRLPVCVPTIRTGVNDTLTVTLGAQSYTVAIPQSDYTGPALATAIQGLLQATAPGSWAVAYDVGNIAMSISCTNNFTITGGTYWAQLKSRPYTQVANKYSFTYVSVQGLDLFYLCSPNFATLDTVGPNGSSDTLMCAVVNEPFGSVLDACMPWNSYVPIPAMTTQSLSFQLRDRNYNLLDIVPNISFVLLIC